MNTHGFFIDGKMFTVWPIQLKWCRIIVPCYIGRRASSKHLLKMNSLNCSSFWRVSIQQQFSTAFSMQFMAEILRGKNWILLLVSWFRTKIGHINFTTTMHVMWNGISFCFNVSHCYAHIIPSLRLYTLLVVASFFGTWIFFFRFEMRKKIMWRQHQSNNCPCTDWTTALKFSTKLKIK